MNTFARHKPVRRATGLQRWFAISTRCAFLAVCVMPMLAGAQNVREAWVARYDGPSSNTDIATAIAVDNNGNVYVTGYSTVVEFDEETRYHLDYVTAKYDANGNQLWVARYNGTGNSDDEAIAIAVDGQGNVYVTGASEGVGTGRDYATVKYDTNGNQLWAARYNGVINQTDVPVALALDNQGNVYVTGYSVVGSRTGFDYATVKYAANGTQLWVARYNGLGNGADQASALTVDSQGNVYVTGKSRGERLTYDDYATVKYDANGNRLWVARYTGPRLYEDSYEYPTALAVDSQGNVYVTGSSQGVGTGLDYATVKYSSSGSQLWVARYNGSRNSTDQPEAIAVDGQGNVYVTGAASYDTGGAMGYATVKYDANGTQLWVARYNGSGNGADQASALTIDSQGSVYVTGRSWESSSHVDYATVKYDANGTQLWVARYNGLGNGADQASALTVDSQGSVYVTGVSDSGVANADYATIKYVQCPALCPADVNGDRIVDDADLLRVLFAFGSSGTNLGFEDVNCDEVVDDADLLSVLFAFGSGC